MVRPSCSRYEVHSQVRYQECLLYSSLHRSLSLCAFPTSEKSLISQHALIPEISQAARVLQLRDSGHVHGDCHQFPPLHFEYWNSSCHIDCIHQRASDPRHQLSAVGGTRVTPQCIMESEHTQQLGKILSCESIKLSLSNPGFIHVRWRYYSAISSSFGGLGSSSKIDGG